MSHKRMPTRKKRHGGHDEEHESHERWLITYADMLTLLMVLFIVLFAMSQVDKKKFAELAQGLASGFGAKSVTFNAQSSIMDGRGSDSSVLPMMPNVSPQLSNSTGAQTAGATANDATAKAAVAAAERATATKQAADVAREIDNLKKVQEEITTARASTVVRYLIGHGMAADRMSAAGFAGTRPLIPPSDPRSVTMNRRVDIVVLSTLPPDERALLPAAAK